jgi:hypothetical protein
VWGVNQYGKSPEAGSADEGPPAPASPPPPPAPPPPPPPPQTTTYAKIEFWNCYSTSVTQLSFRLVDQTTGDDHTYGPFAYAIDGGCGPGVTNPPQTNSLVAGHIYAWQVLDDSNNVLLDDTSEGGPIRGGPSGTAQIVYPPS